MRALKRLWNCRRRRCSLMGGLAVISHSSMWVLAGMLMGGAGRLDATVTEGGIAITLPVFIISILSTASFTWAVARMVHSRETAIRRLTRQQRELQELVAKLLKDRTH